MDPKFCPLRAREERLAQSQVLASYTEARGPFEPFDQLGAPARIDLAFEPITGAWDSFWSAPEMDLARLLARPWRELRQSATAPGCVLIQSSFGTAELSVVERVLSNMAVAARHACAKERANRCCALDAGACWILIPHNRDPRPGRCVFIRKDGNASFTPFNGERLYPRDQETSWPVEELEEASSALWRLFLVAARLLSVDASSRSFIAAAQSELVSKMERAALLEGTAEPGTGARKSAL